VAIVRTLTTQSRVLAAGPTCAAKWDRGSTG